MPTDILAIWNFSDPADSEAKFRHALSTEDDPEMRLEIKTQIARALGLQRRFHEAHKLLDEIEEDCAAHGRAQIRHALERGRAFNSSGNKEAAATKFQSAIENAALGNEEFLHIDALHMAAIVSNSEDAERLNREAIELAGQSDDSAAHDWQGSLLNNLGWTMHDQGRFDEALDLFEQAQRFREEKGVAETILVARWCVARCLRSLGKVEDALELQRELLAKDDGGYTHEEIAECLLLLGRPEEAKPHFARAYEILSKEDWLKTEQPGRLERLKNLSE